MSDRFPPLLPHPPRDLNTLIQNLIRELRNFNQNQPNAITQLQQTLFQYHHFSTLLQNVPTIESLTSPTPPPLLPSSDSLIFPPLQIDSDLSQIDLSEFTNIPPSDIIDPALIDREFEKLLAASLNDAQSNPFLDFSSLVGADTQPQFNFNFNNLSLTDQMLDMTFLNQFFNTNLNPSSSPPNPFDQLSTSPQLTHSNNVVQNQPADFVDHNASIASSNTIVQPQSSTRQDTKGKQSNKVAYSQQQLFSFKPTAQSSSPSGQSGKAKSKRKGSNAQTPVPLYQPSPLQTKAPLTPAIPQTPNLLGSPSFNSPASDSQILTIPGLAPSNAPTWARHAAARAITRRKTSEQNVSCVNCGINIATLYLRGTQNSFELGYEVKVWCVSCRNAPPNAPMNIDNPYPNHNGQSQSNNFNGVFPNPDFSVNSTTLQQIKSQNNSGMSSAPSIDCEVCKKRIAYGGVRLTPSSESSPIISPENWQVPRDMLVEFICLRNCAQKYLFCSECGGGGRSRTGKWRPKQLFEAGRKTCSLPHIRIGDAKVQYRVLEVPRELDNKILQGVQDVFFDMALSLYAIPALIELPKYGSYESVRDEINKQWRETVLDVLTMKVHDPFEILGNNGQTQQQAPIRPKGRSLGKKKYLTVAWINKVQRNKSKSGNKSSNSSSSNSSSSASNNTGQVPWLGKLAQEGMVASNSLPHFPPTEFSNAGENEDRVYVGFCISEWDRDHNTLFMVQIAPRSAFLPTMETYGELLRRAVDRVQADARRDMLAPISHIWCWTRGDHHARLSSIPERLGFVTREVYLQLYPELTEVAPKMFGESPQKVVEEENAGDEEENAGDDEMMEHFEDIMDQGTPSERYPFLQDRGDGRGPVTVYVCHVRDFMAPKSGKRKKVG